MPYMAQGSSKECIVCPSVCLLTTFLKISTMDFSIFLHETRNTMPHRNILIISLIYLNVILWILLNWYLKK